MTVPSLTVNHDPDDAGNTAWDSPTTVVTLDAVTKRYRNAHVLNDVTLRLDGPRIHGLLGRNGAGKTTLLRILAGQALATAGTVHVFDDAPYENRKVLRRTATITEGQRYPDAYSVASVLTAARLHYPRWDDALARDLLADFDLPPRRLVKKLSRGMRSALGVVIGLASRAELTLFDEPYLGLDAVARQIFYDRLLADYAEHPRTIVISTHLIDEVADLLEHIVVLDHGSVLLDADADDLRSSGFVVQGPTDLVTDLIGTRPTLRTERLGATARVTLAAHDLDLDDARRLGLAVTPLSLQELVVATTPVGHPAPTAPEGTSLPTPRTEGPRR
ncbi:MAG: ABC transporter ATP-binding protein [Kineosporiaceae bacterium]